MYESQSWTIDKSEQQLRQNNRGQILVEYVLLMVVAISIALLITSVLVSRNADRPGVLVSKWYDIIKAIGEDPADELNPEP